MTTHTAPRTVSSDQRRRIDPARALPLVMGVGVADFALVQLWLARRLGTTGRG